MSVEIWYGSKPHHLAEQKTLLELYQSLHQAEEHYVLLFNFFAGNGNEIDLVVLKKEGILLAELKHIWGPIFGAREGPWHATREDGTHITLNPDHPNPFKQAQRNYYSWKNWCGEQLQDLNHTPYPTTDWNKVMTYIVLYPDLPEDSEADTGEWPVSMAEMSRFAQALQVRTCFHVHLTSADLVAIPKRLKLQQSKIAITMETFSEWSPKSSMALAARGHEISIAFYRLNKAERSCHTVGRSPNNDLVISAPAVSRQHAQLFYKNGRWIVRDLRSTSGIFVSYQGEPEKEQQLQGRDFALKSGFIVRFGPAAYTFLIHNNEKMNR